MSAMTNRFAEALATGNFHAGKACTDCFVAYVNGDETGNSDDWNKAQYIATCEEWNLTPGHLHDGDFSDCVHVGESCEDDCDCTRDEFSQSTCDLCGSTLAGAREAVTMVKWSVLEQGTEDKA